MCQCGGELLRLLRACQRAAVGRGHVWVRRCVGAVCFHMLCALSRAQRAVWGGLTAKWIAYQIAYQIGNSLPSHYNVG